MWTCPKCRRQFERNKQKHSCKTIPLEQHFKNKSHAKKLFDYLLNIINSEIGTCETISLPCCIHLFGLYDFLAVLPFKDRIEIRFASDGEYDSPQIIHKVKLNKELNKYCINIFQIDEIDTQLFDLIKISYQLKQNA